VDCYNESERFSGWYCYLEEKLKFHFDALCIATSPVAQLKRGEPVEGIGMFEDGRTNYLFESDGSGGEWEYPRLYEVSRTRLLFP
jgi:hypothetical protein